MINPSQLRQTIERKSESGFPSYTTGQITDKVIADDTFVGKKLKRAMDLGITKRQALNFYAYGSAAGEPQPEEKGMVERMGESIRERQSQFGEGIERFKEGEQTLVETGLQLVGRGTGLSSDLFGELISPAIEPLMKADTALKKGAIQAVLPQQLDPMADEVYDATFGVIPEMVIQGLASKPVQKITEWYQGLSPRAKANIESGGSISLAALDVLPGTKAATRIYREMPEILKGATQFTKQAKRMKFLQKSQYQMIKEVDNAIGQVLQGDKKAIQAGKRALNSIDTRGIRTYSELNQSLRQKINALATEQNALLDPFDDLLHLDSFAKVSKVGKTEVATNPVVRAIDHLEELYLKSGNMDKYAEIKELRRVAEEEGITIGKVNLLARQYGADMPSGFSKTGEPLTSVNARMHENTRTALKNSARELLPDDASKLIDKKMADIYDTLALTKKVETKVNALAQKVSKRGIMEAISRKLGRTIDLATFHGLRGFLSSIFPSNVGLKMMNYLQIEENLLRNLNKVDDLLKKIDKMPKEKAAGEIVNLMSVTRKASR